MLRNFIPILLHNSIYIKIKNTFIQSKKQNESLSKLMKLVNISLNYCFFYFLDILELVLYLSKQTKKPIWSCCDIGTILTKLVVFVQKPSAELIRSILILRESKYHNVNQLTIVYCS